MNESQQYRQPGWIQSALVAVLAAQVGLLWLHGGLLNRQHGELQAMRQDIQDLSEALDNSASDHAQAPEEGNFRPASHGQRPKRLSHKRSQHPRLQTVSHVDFILQDTQENAPENQDAMMKELQKSRDSGKKAVADAYGKQQKVSIEYNIQKAEEKKKIEAATSSFYPLVYWAMGLGLLAFIGGRVWRARAGGR
jgi:hypothetical protein